MVTITKAISQPVAFQSLRLAAWILPLAVWVTVVLLPLDIYLVNLVTDDANYYPVVARSIAVGEGSSYDGITQTNGYHPLWAWLQVPIAAATTGLDPFLYLWLVKLFMCGVVVAAVVIWQRLIERVTGSGWTSPVVVLLLGSYWWSVYTLYSGMETPLVIALMGLSLLLAVRLIAADRRSPWAIALGVAMAATFLSRLDAVFFLGALGLAVLFKLRGNFRLLAAWIIPMVLLPLPYLWWNLSHFGSIVPVSGLRKTALSIDLEYQWNIFSQFWLDKLDKLTAFFQPLGVGVLLFGFLFAIYLGRRELRERLRGLGILWVVPAGAVLHYTYSSLFMSEGDIYWYQYGEYLTGFLFAGVVVDSVAAWLRARVRSAALPSAPFVLVFIGVLTLLTFYAPEKLPNQGSLQTYRAALWATNHLGADSETRFGMVDSGIFRVVSGFKTVSLNGLAGDQQILSLVRDGDWGSIIDRFQIAYIVHFYSPEEIAEIPPQYVVFQSDPYLYNNVRPGRMLIVKAAYWAELR